MKINGMQRKRFYKNLIELYNSLSFEDKIEAGVWYNKANAICSRLSSVYSVPLDTVCQVMAILSPATSWENNVKSCEKMLSAWVDGEDISDFTVTTYGQNKLKAWDVLNGKIKLTQPKVSSGMKVYSFYRNILEPKNEDFVTIDRHAIKAMHGIEAAGKVAVNKTEYTKAKTIYSDVAKELNLVPSQFQAMCWVAYKQKVGR